ncbi:copine-8-like isoform X2 [Gordionus sp. m RMFG-2023]|uniref:copine-8-like isoform X2 n=1 Tax=Gordionus sp. m RMFG-2023 TaxID=3053472 RepID=UPI0031FC12EF
MSVLYPRMPSMDSNPSSQIELSIECNNLRNADWLSKSDPMVIVYIKNHTSKEYFQVGKTETVQNSLNPKFHDKILLDYYFEMQQFLKFEVYDIDSKSQKLSDHDFLGSLECTLGEIVSTINAYTKKLNHSNTDSQITRPSNLIVIIGTLTKGSFMTNLEELSHSVQDNKNFEIINSQRKKSSAVNAGTVSLILYSMRKIHTFLEFIKAGTQIHCTFAIDFTSSNGDPQNVNSLHHIQTDKNLLNQYELAITSVGDIIQDYDSDKLFPVLGFGARFPLTGMVSHEFFVNMKTDNPYCEGIPGVLDAYRNCLRQIQLYGPTNFAPVIKHVTKFASSYRDGSNYFILLIITDGIISDMPMTKEALVNASNLPISVIIVGVGDADFTAMEELDGDIIPLSSSNQTASRDIVQFVPLRDFQASSLNLSDRISSIASQKYRLAKEILAEIPLQFISYMNSIHATPELVANIKR